MWWVEPFRELFLPRMAPPGRPGLVADPSAPGPAPGQLPVNSYKQGEAYIPLLVLGTFNVAKVLSLPAAALVARGYGRPACLLVGVLLFGAGVLLGVLAWSATQLLLGIAVPGMGSAFMHTAVLLADAEVAPSAVRGTVAASPMLAATAAYGAPFLMLLAPALRGSPWGWRVVW